MRTIEIKSKYHRFFYALLKQRSLKLGRVTLYYGIDTLDVTEDIWDGTQSLTTEYIGIDISYSKMFGYFSISLIIIGLNIKI